MGIRHLEHFMRYDVPNGLSTVCLEQEVKNFQRLSS